MSPSLRCISHLKLWRARVLQTRFLADDVDDDVIILAFSGLDGLKWLACKPMGLTRPWQRTGNLQLLNTGFFSNSFG